MNAEDFDGLFDHFTNTVVRVEAGRRGAAGGAEAERVAAFRAGRARPERSVRTNRWLARIATTTVLQGKEWSRYRVVDDPPTEYQRYQFDGYLEAQAVGDRVMMVPRAVVPADLTDYWLFDAATDHPHAVLMHYRDDGSLADREPVHDPTALADLATLVQHLAEHAVPLNEYLAGRVQVAAGHG